MPLSDIQDVAEATEFQTVLDEKQPETEQLIDDRIKTGKARGPSGSHPWDADDMNSTMAGFTKRHNDSNMRASTRQFFRDATMRTSGFGQSVYSAKQEEDEDELGMVGSAPVSLLKRNRTGVKPKQ